MGRKKKGESYLLDWRRREVAQMTFENIPVIEQAKRLKVDERTIYRDVEYNEAHAKDLLKNYLVKTVPNIISRSIYQINLANGEVIKILKDESTPKKERIAAALAVAKTARDIIEIIAGNRGVVDKALEFDESLKEALEKQEEEEEEVLDNNNNDIVLSGNSTQEQESGKAESEDPQAVF
jgi:hypothetical protein